VDVEGDQVLLAVELAALPHLGQELVLRDAVLGQSCGSSGVSRPCGA
jgi:hypothetical protein